MEGRLRTPRVAHPGIEGAIHHRLCRERRIGNGHLDSEMSVVTKPFINTALANKSPPLVEDLLEQMRKRAFNQRRYKNVVACEPGSRGLVACQKPPTGGQGAHDVFVGPPGYHSGRLFGIGPGMGGDGIGDGDV